jgi:AsmA protein
MNPTDTPTKPRRRWIIPALAAAVLLALALTPPYLNVNRLQRRIAASMSEALGRPVHLGRVTLHLLPLPGFTLEDLVVSEDPAFGFEPIIRANKVEITLRISSLWRRQVEISSVRFEVDDQGSGPSLNLVRNPAGRWNLQSLLMHAAAASGTPTNPGTPSKNPGAPTKIPGGPFMRDASPAHEWGSTNPNPAPPFPYIEATGARVNVKLGDEKKPFSLTDTDFALWLSNPTTWQIRVEAKPARTDRNISDPGTIKLEGSLQRAAAMAEVPVNLTAAWEGAPLGEASLLLSGADANFRGKLTVAATLTGKLGAAALTARAHLEDLRRSDFVPAHPLDLTAACSGTLDLTTAIVTAPACALTTPAVKTPLATAASTSVDLSRLTQPGTLLGLRIGSPALPESFILDAARLFSQRIPASATATGTLAASATLTPAGFLLEPVHLHPDPHPNPHPDERSTGTEPTDTPLLLEGLATSTGYTLHLTGPIAPSELTATLKALPPLTDGLPPLLEPASRPSETGKRQPEPTPKPIQLDLTCTRLWHGPQTCSQTTAPEPTHKKHRR